jgi:hypothetical protein
MIQLYSSAFDIVDHSLLLQKRMLWLYTPCYIVDKELPVNQKTEGVL